MENLNKVCRVTRGHFYCGRQRANPLPRWSLTSISKVLILQDYNITSRSNNGKNYV